ncbi:isoprenylcysteine carboxyl methyltransferase family protein [Actinocorallia sp. A-T 12471]|uniref:isoprenylcysteine carboxyl methyltransferase family protein n=1 Tax=Actinocorallia sp. A-T 12471 TaxID=3089813 RepID=UPI0029D2468A|nr:isoprenylcysteine carboxyl methyltransferase family protein [Actinocorallia sp. A-T 12471]MDX6745015.1 isoprenylcysteine carboxyl methyltransferase family protein [Actinocorallia sp. A-T 12471]
MSGWYAALVCLVGLERLAELKVARRNLQWSRALGGVESGRDHYPLIVALHVGLLAGCLLEPVLLDRPFIPALGWPMLALVAAAQGLRWWCIRTLGPQWNTRVIVVPGLPRVTRGPYRYPWLPHPNYLAVALEGFALPLVHTAWLTALTFTLLNLPLTAHRLKTENTALKSLTPKKA